MVSVVEKTPKKSTGNLTQDALGHSRDLLLALSRAAQSIQRARTAEEVYRAVGDQIKSLGGVVSMFMVEEDPEQLAVAYTSYESNFLKQAEQLTGLAALGYRFTIPPEAYMPAALPTAKPSMCSRQGNI